MIATSKDLVGQIAPDFTLKDEKGEMVNLYTVLKSKPVLLVFYPGDFRSVCTAQLCNYRDNLQAFQACGVEIMGISGGSKESHFLFSKRYEFPFPLLSDIGNKVAKDYNCTSVWMFGGLSRAVYIIGPGAKVLYRYVEPTMLSKRNAGELLEIVRALKSKGLLQGAT